MIPVRFSFEKVAPGARSLRTTVWIWVAETVSLKGRSSSTDLVTACYFQVVLYVNPVLCMEHTWWSPKECSNFSITSCVFRKIKHGHGDSWSNIYLHVKLTRRYEDGGLKCLSQEGNELFYYEVQVWPQYPQAIWFWTPPPVDFFFVHFVFHKGRLEARRCLLPLSVSESPMEVAIL